MAKIEKKSFLRKIITFYDKTGILRIQSCLSDNLSKFDFISKLFYIKAADMNILYKFSEGRD